MGNVVFAAPGLAHHRLHAALARELQSRGHSVRGLTPCPATARFYSLLGLPTDLLPARISSPGGRSQLPHIPVSAAALRDCALAGRPRPGIVERARIQRRHADLAPVLVHEFSLAPPDLVYFHAARTGTHQLMQFVAGEFGADILHTGPGLLPGTMQWDGSGVDCDASKLRRTAKDYARVPRDEGFLTAALAATLGEARPDALPPTSVPAPRLGGMFSILREGAARDRLAETWGALRAWRRQHAGSHPSPRETLPTVGIPHGPFVAVLLQEPASPSVVLDAVDPPSHAELILAAHAAAWHLDSTLPVVVLPPRGGLERGTLRRLGSRVGAIQGCADGDRMTALTTAACVVTLNHPHALTAVLAGTPVVHLAPSVYAHAGVAAASTCDRLRHDLPRIVAAPNPPHRESYLTRTLMYDHVWCDPTEPDANGIAGLVENIEKRIDRLGQSVQPIDYRAGPIWPLTPKPSTAG